MYNALRCLTSYDHSFAKMSGGSAKTVKLSCTDSEALPPFVFVYTEKKTGLWSGAEHGARSTGARAFLPGAEPIKKTIPGAVERWSGAEKNSHPEQWSGAEQKKNMPGAVERRKFDCSAAPAHKTENTKKEIFRKNN
jgi:hypothetical protein